MFTQIIALLEKDIKSEYRRKYSIMSIILFIFISATIIVFCTKNIEINTNIFAGLLWVLMFFASMTGLSKSFQSEEERGTYLFLKLLAKPYAIYFSKLIFNIMLSIILNIISLLLFLMFFDNIHILSLGNIFIVIIISSIGLASCSTIISAIIAKGSSKNALYPILSAPILLPLIFLGVEATIKAIESNPFSAIQGDMIVMFCYSGIIIVVSYLLFDVIWEE